MAEVRNTGGHAPFSISPAAADITAAVFFCFNHLYYNNDSGLDNLLAIVKILSTKESYYWGYDLT